MVSVICEGTSLVDGFVAVIPEVLVVQNVDERAFLVVELHAQVAHVVQVVRIVAITCH